MFTGGLDISSSASGLEDLFFEIARGTHPNFSIIHKTGHNEAISTSREDIWDFGGIYVYPPSASTMTVSSDDANDTLAGTGGRTVEIFGLDASYDEITETVDMNGLTAVTTANSYIRVYRARVVTADSTNTNTNIGDIFVGTGVVTAGVPANVYAQISAAHGRTLMAVYTIPNNKKGYLYLTQASSGTQKSTDVGITVTPFGEATYEMSEIHFYQDIASKVYVAPEVFSAKTDISIRASVDAGSSPFSGDMTIILESLV